VSCRIKWLNGNVHHILIGNIFKERLLAISLGRWDNIKMEIKRNRVWWWELD
jgi:hypothetical protein